MDSLTKYLEQIVWPTISDFMKNPTSIRHAFLACVALYHALDRAAEICGISRGNLLKQWRRQSMSFGAVDKVAHDFKHIYASDRKVRPPYEVSEAFVLYGQDDPLGDGQLDLHRLLVYGRLAFAFARDQADLLKKSRSNRRPATRRP